MARLGSRCHVHQNYHCLNLHGTWMVAQKSHWATLSGWVTRPEFRLFDPRIGSTCRHLIGIGLGRSICSGPWDCTYDHQWLWNGYFHPEADLSIVVAFDICFWPHHITIKTVQEVIWTHQKWQVPGGSQVSQLQPHERSLILLSNLICCHSLNWILNIRHNNSKCHTVIHSISSMLLSHLPFVFIS